VRVEVARGHAPRALRALRALARVGPLAAEGGARAEDWAREAGDGWPRARAEVEAAHGRPDLAAALLESAAQAPGADRETRCRLRLRAAALRARAGDFGGAAAVAARAADAAPADLRAHADALALAARHRATDAHGVLGPGMAWAGDALERDLAAWAARTRGAPGRAAALVAFASGALAAGREEVALRLYREAASDPAFRREARAEPALADALTPALALLARRALPDEARRLAALVDALRGDGSAEARRLVERIAPAPAR
jgi:hypothetical protein